jgi:hypothetical protein
MDEVISYLTGAGKGILDLACILEQAKKIRSKALFPRKRQYS